MRKKIMLIAGVIIVIAACLFIFSHYKQASLSATDKAVPPIKHSEIETPSATENKKPETPAYGNKIDMSKWLYNPDDRVYYQLDLVYCRKPVDLEYQKMAVFVPEQFLKCTENTDKKTYSCTPNNAAMIEGYTVHSAPIVMPVDTPEYQAVPALKEYKNFSKYTNAGFVYIHAGCRGIEHGAPAGVTDLKAAIRYIRYNKTNIPANTDLIYVFGFSGGGAQSAILGASGDSALYRPYLQQIGAIESTGDAVHGVMAWSPVTALESANEAYEWGMGYTRKNLTSNKQQLSNIMAREYVSYVNNSGFRDENRDPLLLQYSPKGIYRAGTYYDYIKLTIERSLSEFLRNTKFPYTHPRDKYEFGQYSSGKKPIKGEIELSGTYLTRRQYLRALNAKYKWVEYNFTTGATNIRSVEDFIRGFKPAVKEIGAFDGYERQQLANKLFAVAGEAVHFDDLTAKIYKNTGKAESYADDLVKQDALGITVRQRRDMYSPLYYLLPASRGYRSSKVADFWRIRSGINQTETALTTEINLALALYNYPTVKNTDFKTVWGKWHEKAEAEGQNPEDVFISWVTRTLRTNWMGRY